MKMSNLIGALAAIAAFFATGAVHAQNGCGTSIESCCVSHDSPGCSNPSCCAYICAIDPYCCATTWDSICANEAIANCPSCTAPATSCTSSNDSCCTAHATPYCSNPTCCGIVCAMDAYCCNNQWDTVCANEAIANCATCGTAAPTSCGNSNDSCCTAHGTPYCSNPGCCAIVCALDPYCCNTQWDGICAGEAIANCATCGTAAPTSCDNSDDSCCVAHPAPFCSNPGCCAIVCALDPYCCSNQWDSICANEASQSCSECLPTLLPLNNECVAATDVGLGNHFFDTTNATDSTNNFPLECSFNGTGIFKDVWFRYVHAGDCVTDVTVSTCDTAAFDTILAVSTGCSGTVIACNDDACDVQSSVTFSAAPGTAYLIRLGGYLGASGAGALVISAAPCPPACGTVTNDCCLPAATPFCADAACCSAVCAVDPFCCSNHWDSICANEATGLCASCAIPCPWDINGSGSVDGADLGALLGNWGGAGTGDFDGNGIVNGADLGQLLGHWGNCP